MNISFDIGMIVQHYYVRNSGGYMKSSKDILLKGTVLPTNSFGDVKVLYWENSRVVWVEFIESGGISHHRAADILRGSIKDYHKATKLGGFIGQGRYFATDRKTKKTTPAYMAWAGILTRCNDESQRWKYPTYSSCSVCDEWLNFQNFAKWHEENFFTGGQVDKDTKFKGNKYYSPMTCQMIPKSDNVSAAGAGSYIVTTPEGDDIDVENLSEFCRNNGLSQANMASVATGKRNHHKGYKVKYKQSD